MIHFSRKKAVKGRKMSEQKYIWDIFSGMDDGEIDDILSMDGVDNISLPAKSSLDAESGIYLISYGRIRVCKKENGKEIFLKYLLPGDSFGYSGLFRKHTGENPCLLYAKESTGTVFIPEDVLVEIIKKFPSAAVNIIALLADKIRFLNKKIDSFTSPTTESRLLKYLQSCPVEEDGKVILYDNMAELARKLDMGRASLYRAFDSLEVSGDVKKINGVIYMLKKRRAGWE